ncbi:MAG TPA: hypothetical protein DIW17_11420 [Clostridiales bacterium]|nr:EAL domain-containing protein [Clostridia bacterium]HCS74467.1 hypothetical protein [Clostridiales bacterium]
MKQMHHDPVALINTSVNTIEQIEQYGRQSHLRNDLVKAISTNQFQVHYQPMINLQTNEIIAAEAFIRWEHPRYGTLLPNEFISIAEESDFILEMGNWTLDRVCHDYSGWLTEGLSPIKIAVNYSSVQFLQKDFVDNIHAIIKKYNLEPGFVIIEILERVSIRNFNQVKSNIEELHDLGIQVALDDFGTGFSSLEYLSKLNIDVLKVDQMFTQTANNDSTNAVIIETILILAEKLGIQVVAEGIETLEQLDFLISRNCLLGQGYYFRKPMSSREYKCLLREKTCIPGEAEPPTVDDHEKRKYYRLQFPLYLEASMTILKDRGNDVHYGSTLVLIRDISAGGLCFYTTMDISIKSNLLIQFTTTLFGKQVTFYGTPVWTKKVKKQLYKYGIEFRLSDEKKSLLNAFIHQLQLEIEKDGGIADGDFVRQSPSSYFQV